MIRYITLYAWRWAFERRCILLLEGDGIGPEIAAATARVLAQVNDGLGLDLEIQLYADRLRDPEKAGTTFLPETLEAARASDATILGPVSHNDYPPVAEGGINPSRLRIGLDLYANIRRWHEHRPGFAPPCGKALDLVIVRENTEGFYADRSMFLDP